MLVLTRKRNEIIQINGGSDQEGGVTLQVVDIKGDKVRLGFTADRTISINRDEVEKIIQKEQADS